MQQLSLSIPTQHPRSLYEYGSRTSGATHGVVLTKPHIVELLLDLSQYTEDRDLGIKALLEPACGNGAFLVPAVSRLLRSAERFGRQAESLEQAILAFDIEPSHVEETKRALLTVLQNHKVERNIRHRLVEAWIRQDDFLLASISRRFNVVVGNPPYIRIEQIAEVLQNDYRQRYRTLYDRADLYVAFIERGLQLLSAEGVLSFICADRWVSNKYGAPLRELISSKYEVRCYIDLHNASPFESDVIAYPSIFVMAPGRTTSVRVVTMASGSESECRAVSAIARGENQKTFDGLTVSTYKSWFSGSEPWVLGSPEHLEILRALESRFAPIDTTARIGIGVASGHDKTYIVDATADIESDRLVPLVMRGDIKKGTIKASGRFIINTFLADGRIVDLDKYPRLKRHFSQRADAIRGRHVAQKNVKSWFRTIDRVYPDLVSTPKLLIPDIAGSNEIAFDEGRYHPHHNLYFITSAVWDLEVLGGLLSSRVALFFVWSYAVKMRGGYLRFQAQYLRRIRLPDPGGLSNRLAKAIRVAFKSRDFASLDALALQAYQLDSLPAFDFVDTRT